MIKPSEDIKFIHDKINNGETAWLTEEEIKEIENYALETNNLRILNNLISEPMGDGSYKCYL